MACSAVASAVARLPHAAAALPPELRAAAAHTASTVRLADLTHARLVALLAAERKPAYRAAQIMDALYRRAPSGGGALAPPLTCWSQLTSLPLADRAWLAGAFNLDAGALSAAQLSSDGTRKWLYTCPGDGAAVETVFIPDAARRRGTVCVSSQVGCTLACTFCRTGTQPLARNLSAGDVTGQVLAAMRAVDAARAAAPPGDPARPPPVNRVVLMGQGEPLFNYTAVLRALDTLTHAHGLALPAHRVTLSTAGVAPMIARLAAEGPLGLRLAVSLHAPTDALRGELMDVNARWGVAEVMEAVKEYIHVTSARWRSGGDDAEGARARRQPPQRQRAQPQEQQLRGGPPAVHHAGDDDDSDDEDAASGAGRAQQLRLGPADAQHQRHNGRRRGRVSFEYVGLAVNTQAGSARELLRLLTRHLPPALAHVNIIPFNEWQEQGGGGGGEAAAGLVAPAPMPQLLAFQRVLAAGGVRTTLRTPRGTDILGACGQLKSDRTGSGVSR